MTAFRAAVIPALSRNRVIAFHAVVIPGLTRNRVNPLPGASLRPLEQRGSGRWAALGLYLVRLTCEGRTAEVRVVKE